MFYSDPNLYGATFPFKDITTPLHNPFFAGHMPWMNVPKFVPPSYGFWPRLEVPATLPFAQQAATFPYAHQAATPSFTQPTYFNPYIPSAISPFTTPFNMNLQNYNVPLYNWYRPFGF